MAFGRVRVLHRYLCVLCGQNLDNVLQILGIMSCYSCNCLQCTNATDVRNNVGDLSQCNVRPSWLQL